MDNAVNVLGQKYDIITHLSDDDPKLGDKNYGYLEPYSHKIVIKDFSEERKDDETVEKLDEFIKKVLRHETVHAFFMESGLAGNADYYNDEELIDWIAIQSPKMFECWKKAGLL